MNMQSTIKALVDRSLEDKSKFPSMNALAKAMGLNQPTLLRIYNGESKDPKRQNIEKIAHFYHCDVDDLHSGAVLSRDKADSPTLLPSSNSQAARESSDFAPHRGGVMQNALSAAIRATDIEIPQYDVAGAMGDGGLALRDQPGVIANWHVSPEWLHKNVRHCSSSKNLCIVTGFGDSMRPMYNPGDPLLVDTGVRTVEADAVYFFRVGNEGFIKRIQRIPGLGYVVKSSNPEYDPWTVTSDMDFQVLGRVLKVWRSEDF